MSRELEHEIKQLRAELEQAKRRIAELELAIEFLEPNHKLLEGGEHGN